jgi:hypothetical protein
LPRCDQSAHYFQLFQYNALGGSTGELLLSPFLSPEIFWGKLFRPGNLSFLLLLLLPFCPAIWKAPRLLLAALPIILGVALKDCYLDKHNIVQWYGVEISVWFMAAMIYGIKAAYLQKRVTAGLIAALLLGACAGYYFVGKTPVGGTYSASAVRQSPDIRKLREYIRKSIPPESSVALSQKWGAQLVGSHKNLIFDLSHPDADYVILDFSDPSAEMKQMMLVRDKMFIERKGHPFRFLNLRGCQVAIFKKGHGSWQLPFFISGTPEKILPDRAWIPLNSAGIRAKHIFLKQKNKLLIFASVKEGFNSDVSFKITAVRNNDRRHWELRWGYGLYPAYMMDKNQSFVIDLPIPSHWESIDTLHITTNTYER